MKKILFFLLTCFFILDVNALELSSFEVTNGNLSIPFDSKNNLYTVYLNEDAKRLEFNYDIDLNVNDYEIEVLNNQYKNNQSEPVVIQIKNKATEEMASYTFYLTKEEESAVFNEYIETETENTKEIEYLEYYVGGACLLSIIVLFKVIVIGFKK